MKSDYIELYSKTCFYDGTSGKIELRFKWVFFIVLCLCFGLKILIVDLSKYFSLVERERRSFWGHFGSNMGQNYYFKAFSMDLII